MEREISDARRAHRRFVAAAARVAELESLRRSAILTALAAGASQSQVARELGIHPSTVNRIVHGTGKRRRA